jgi:hypothetical protein
MKLRGVQKFIKPTVDDNREVCDELPSDFAKLKSRIMYIENKGAGGIQGPAKIGRVYFSKTGKTLYYQSRILRSLKGSRFKSNYFDVKSGEEFWISGFSKKQDDRLYGGFKGVEVDEDVKSEYRSTITARTASP